MIDRSMILRRFPLASVLEKDGIKVRGSGVNRMAPCPFHKDKTPSFSVNVQKQTWYCFAGCGGGSVIDYIAKRDARSIEDVLRDLSEKVSRTSGTARSLQNLVQNAVGSVQTIQKTMAKDIAQPMIGNGEKLGTLVCSYNYEGPTGKVLYRVNRYDPKDFRQQHLVGDKWVWGMENTERVLYHLPEILAAGDKPIWLCYSDDTELLTTVGWKRINQLNSDELLAQYNSATQKITFGRILKSVVMPYNGDLISISSEWSALLTTPDHRCLIKKYPRKTPQVVAASDIRRRFLLPVSGFFASSVDGPTANQARIIAAYQADGTTLKSHPTELRWGFRKQRKIVRLKSLLSAEGISCKEAIYSGVIHLSIKKADASWIEAALAGKTFRWCIINWPLVSRYALLDELSYWDGDRRREQGGRYFTSIPENAEIIVATASLSGIAATTRSKVRGNRKPECIVSLKYNVQWRELDTAPSRRHYDGRVYCVTVEHGFVVTKRQGKVTICGNCEGEKDSDALRALGFTATTNVGGAGAWLDGYTECLAGKDLVLCGDQDEVGKEAVATRMGSLDGKARRLRVISFPATFCGKDISDYLNDFGSTESQKAAVNELLERAAIIVQGSTLEISSMADMEAEYIDFLKRSKEVSYSFNNWLPSLQFKLRPAVPGDVICFVASTGSGKTAILQNIAVTSGLPTLLFQLELSSVVTFERFLSLAMQMRQSEVEEAYRNQEMPEWRKTGKLDNVYVCNRSALSVDSIETLVKRAELKMKRPVLVLIDYVQLCNGMGKSRYEKMTGVASDLKSMAKNCGVILVVASQVMRKPDDNREIGLQDAKDSGAIEHSANLHFGLWRDADDATLLWLKLNKNTRGYSGLKLACNFDGARMLITERTPQP